MLARLALVMGLAVATSGCVAPMMAAPMMQSMAAATSVGAGLTGQGAPGSGASDAAPGKVVATREPSPVDGPLNCEGAPGSYRCVGGEPGHARWCNDFLAVNPGAGPGNAIFSRYCLDGEVPPDVAALR